MTGFAINLYGVSKMNLTLEHILGAASILIAGIIWFIRLEAKVLRMKDDLDDHKKILDKKFEDEKEKDKVMWSKIDSIQSSINIMIQSIVRVETKLDIQQHKDEN